MNTTPTPPSDGAAMPLTNEIQDQIERCGVQIVRAMHEINSPCTEELIDALISLQSAVNYLHLKVQAISILEAARTKERQ